MDQEARRNLISGRNPWMMMRETILGLLGSSLAHKTLQILTITSLT
jgi:hypothetical protein